MQEIPFRLASPQAPLIVVPVLVNDEGPFDFILDTGAGTMVVGEELAAKLTLPRGTSQEGHGATAPIEVVMTTLESLSIGDQQGAPLEAAIMDLKPLRMRIGAEIDGIIGHNFLREFRVSVDYPRGRLELNRG